MQRCALSELPPKNRETKCGGCVFRVVEPLWCCCGTQEQALPCSLAGHSRCFGFLEAVGIVTEAIQGGIRHVHPGG